MSSDIAIAHKDNEVDGGGERLATALGKAFDAPVFSGFVPEGRDTEMRDLFADQGLIRRLIERGGITRQAAYMVMWQQHADALREYDTVITSGNEPLWYTPEDDQTLVAYCHHTLRQQHDRVAEVDHWSQTLYGMAVQVLFDHNTAKPDLWVCNSDLTAHRLTHYWGIPTDRIRVVYPPVPVSEFGLEHADRDGEYYFACSRLVGHKRFEEAVRAFDGFDGHLKIAGKGDDRERLEELAGENVQFLGYISEREKRRRLAEAKAYVFPAAREDFGIAPAEALASGTPLITVDEGFPAMMVDDGGNGLTYDRGVGNLRQTLHEFERDGVSWSAEEIASFADRFNVDRFEREMREVVEEARERTRVEPEWAAERPERVPMRADGDAE